MSVTIDILKNYNEQEDTPLKYFRSNGDRIDLDDIPDEVLSQWVKCFKSQRDENEATGFLHGFICGADAAMDWMVINDLDHLELEDDPERTEEDPETDITQVVAGGPIHAGDLVSLAFDGDYIVGTNVSVTAEGIYGVAAGAPEEDETDEWIDPDDVGECLEAATAHLMNALEVLYPNWIRDVKKYSYDNVQSDIQAHEHLKLVLGSKLDSMLIETCGRMSPVGIE